MAMAAESPKLETAYGLSLIHMGGQGLHLKCRIFLTSLISVIAPLIVINHYLFVYLFIYNLLVRLNTVELNMSI